MTPEDLVDEPDPLYDLYQHIETREDLAALVSAFRHDLRAHPDDWENVTLDDFLEAMSAWITDADFMLTDDIIATQPIWRTFADILMAARIYE